MGEPLDWDEFRDNEEWEHFMGFLRRMQEAHEERVIEDATQALASLPATPAKDLPQPNTCHPSLERHAPFVIGHDQPHVKIPKPKLPGSLRLEKQEVYPTKSAVDLITLQATRYWAPAPFIGNPLHEVYIYTWKVWKDEYGRHIAGDTTLECHQRIWP